MRFDQIDPILMPWAREHGLHVFTESRDDEVRAIDIVDDAGDSYALAVSSMSNDGVIDVWVSEQRLAGRSVPRRKIRSRMFTTTVAELQQTLEVAYRQAEAWIAERGNTRTPIE